MKRIVYLLTVALAALFVTSCGNMFGPTTDYTASDLKGTWTEEANPLCYWVYSLDKDDSGEYYWGKTWDEAEDVHESDVDADYHGNGWFKWKISSNKLTLIHMMNISDAAIPQVFTITSCNSTTLVLKDSYETLTYKKVQ